MTTRARYRNGWIVAAAFATIAALSGVGAFRLGKGYHDSLAAATAREASAIAHGKAALVEQWREERLRDGAAVSAASNRFAPLWRSIVAGDGRIPPPVLSWLESLQSRGYRVAVLIDAEGVSGRRIGEPRHPVVPDIAAAVRDAFALRRPALSDIHPMPLGPAHIDLVVPLYDSVDAPAGALAFPLDAAKELYPLVQSAAPNATEPVSVLVRSRGDSDQILGPLLNTVSHAASVTAREPVPGSSWSVVVRVPTQDSSNWIGLSAHAFGAIAGLAIAVAIVACRVVSRLKLRGASRLVARVVETAPNAMYIFDLDRQAITYCNGALAVFAGRTPEEIASAGLDFATRMIHPEDHAARKAAADRFGDLADGQVQETQLRMRNAAGEWRWIRCAEVVFSRARNGKVREILGTAEDVTARVCAEDQFDATNQLVNAAFDAIPLSLIVISPDGAVLRWNKHCERMFGWTADEALGAYPPTVPPELLPESRSMLAAVAGGMEMRGHEVIRKRKDGTEIDVAMWTAPVRDRNGATLAIFSAFMDITEEKRRRAELEKSRASLLHAQQIAGLGSWHRDLRTNEGSWSDNTYRILGLHKGEVEGTFETYLNAVHPEDRAVVKRSYEETLQTGRPYRTEHRIVRPDGALRIVQQWAEVGMDGNGVPITAAGTLQDITEQRSIQQQLWQAQKLDTVGRIAGGIAHDFNNVLTIVNGYAELLGRRAGDSAFVATGAREIMTAAKAASDLTTKLLAFSRKQVLEPKPVDLSAVVRSMTSLLSGLLGDSVRLVVDAPEQLPAVMADPIQLDQVLMNLALNARDAMPSGGLFRISLRDAGTRIRLEVSDTGIGMCDETRARLFEPFFTTKEPGKGTGLGLSTVYGIVTQSGGTISVDSAPGKGATFRIHLPTIDAFARCANNQQLINLTEAK